MDKKYLFSVRACASSANLGPGFDRAAIALNIFNRYRVAGLKAGFEVRDVRSGQPAAAKDSLMVKAIKHTLKICGHSLKEGLAVDYEQDIIPGAGMGSSAAEIVGGVMIADRAYRLGLDAGSRLDIAYALEHHPDNVAAALGGGMVVCYRDKGRYHYQKVAVCPQLEILLFIPRTGVVTEEARHLIPEKIPVADAADNIANFCLLTEALKKGDLGRAAIFIRDKIHQPYRSSIYPRSIELVNRLIDDWGIPAAISGSGPSVVAFFHRNSRAAQSLEFEGFKLIRTSIDFNGSMYY